MDRIILAFSKDETAHKVRMMLDGSGYKIHKIVCHSASELLRTAYDYDDILIIMGYKLPDGVVNDIYYDLHGNFKMISIVKPERVEDIEEENIFALPLPLSRQRLLDAIEVLCGSVEEHKRKKGERSPEETKLIERAKLFLMENYHMTESQAHRFMQKRSMDTGNKIADTAKVILNL